MIARIGGDRFKVIRGRGRPDPSSFPPLPPEFNGWIYLDSEAPDRLHYFNYMGERVPFCGNATRVVGYLLLGGRDGETHVLASGPKRVRVRGEWVGIELPVRAALRADHAVMRMEGVEHFVMPVRNVLAYHLKALYDSVEKAGLRYHINIYEPVGDAIFVRTWEYGHPREALGCATGTLSSAAHFIITKGMHRVRTRVLSGDEGVVSGDGEIFILWNRLRLDGVLEPLAPPH
ncbi:MAG: hypothetical protein GXO29_03535 [Thermotogae bacterium]|nr:hypothetical protein [Thermotogota bacterium]